MKVMVAAAIAAMLLLLPIRAWSDSPGTAGTTGEGLWTQVNNENHVGTSTAEPSVSAAHQDGHYVTITACVTGAETACHDPGICPGGSPEIETYFVTADGDTSIPKFRCPEAPQASPKPQLTAGMIASAFRRIPLPASPLLIQPSGGRTIVNFPTIAYTTAGPQLSRSVTLLGHHVAFRIHADTFTWHWGDGQSTTTHDPGTPYQKNDPDLHGEITHKYEQKSTFEPRLDTTYTADYRVDDGAWQPVDGSVTITGEPQELRADTYTPVLVSH
jgi:hypothetical protein